MAASFRRWIATGCRFGLPLSRARRWQTADYFAALTRFNPTIAGSEPVGVAAELSSTRDDGAEVHERHLGREAEDLLGPGQVERDRNRRADLGIAGLEAEPDVDDAQAGLPRSGQDLRGVGKGGLGAGHEAQDARLEVQGENGGLARVDFHVVSMGGAFAF